MFFTRIPIPFTLPWSKTIMNQSQKYYSWTGLIVGVVYAVVYYLVQLVLGNEIAVILATVAGVLLTGAFHEDGFTDVCDSFGGGYGKEKILSIMKDSRIGAYGAVGIVLLLLLKYQSLVQLANTVSISLMVFLFIFSNAASRFIAVTTIYTHRYVRDSDDSKAKPVADEALPLPALFIGFLALLIPLLAFGEWLYILALPIAYVGKICLAAYFKKHIGGYTGDCLGAIQQITEVIIYLSALLIWKYT